MSSLHWPRNIKLFSSGTWKFWARFGWLWLSLNSSTILQLMPVNPWRHKQRYPLSETPVWQVAFKWQWLLEQLFCKRVGKQLNNWKKQPKRSRYEKKRKGKEKENKRQFFWLLVLGHISQTASCKTFPLGSFSINEIFDIFTACSVNWNISLKGPKYLMNSLERFGRRMLRTILTYNLFPSDISDLLRQRTLKFVVVWFQLIE